MGDTALDLEGVEDAYPLTAAQLGMLFHTLAEPGTGVYIGLFSATLPADIDLKAFKAAWDAVANRHQALRTVFVWEKLETPVQVVLEQANLHWEEVKRPPDADEQETQLIEAVQAGVDLKQAPATRLLLLRGNDGPLHFAWLCHHALIDVWSAALVMGEVARVYLELTSGPTAELEGPMLFRDFVDWSANADVEASEAHWLRALGDYNEPTLLQLLPPEITPYKASPQGSIEFELDAETTAGLLETARLLRVTPSAVIGTIWGVVLHRVSGQDDVLFGVAATLRPPELMGSEAAVGNFVTTIPSRIIISREPTLRSLIGSYHEHQLAGRMHATLPLNQIHQLSGLPNNETLFETILSVETRSDAFEDAKALFETPSARDRSNFPMSVIVNVDRQLSCKLLYDVDRFAPEAVSTVSSMLKQALLSLAEQLDDAPSDLRVLDAASDGAAMRGVEGGDLPDFDLVHREILAHADRTPERVALIENNKQVTYRELDDKSRMWAEVLTARGIGPGDRVGIFMERNYLAIIAMIAALRAGCAYIPIDAGQGSERTSEILRTCGASAILTRKVYVQELPVDTASVVVMDEAAPAVKKTKLPISNPGDTAYIIYTSGSTGQPKGVAITNANLAASTAARFGFYERTPEVFLLLSSIAFDSSVVGIYWTLAAGGTLVLPAPGAEKDVPVLCEMIRDQRVTHLLGLPSLLELICEYAPISGLASLTTGISAGEELTNRFVAKWQDTVPTARLYNEYGPTETTVWCIACEVTQASLSTKIPIGQPIPGACAYVRDLRGRVVPNGLPGELWIGGPIVSNGYINASELTDEKFVPNPLHPSQKLYRTGDLVRLRTDGTFEYLGRTDQQVKIRGHRIELGEIEAALTSMEPIKVAVVQPFLEGPDLQLAAYIVLELDALLSVDTLRDALRKNLPDWMVPARYVVLGDLPKTATGKIDRRALQPPPNPESHDAILPQTALEHDLAAIWKEVLWLDRQVGTNEDFVVLGGHSLLSIRLINEIESRLGVRIPIAQLGKLTTISDQARQIKNFAKTPKNDVRGTPDNASEDEGLFDGLNEKQLGQMHAYMAGWPGDQAWEGSMYRGLNLNGTLPPLFWCFNWGKEFAGLAKALGPDQPLYGTRSGHLVLDVSPETQQQDNRRVAMQSVSEVIRIQPNGPYYIGGNCQGAAIAMETAQVLNGLALPVGLVLMMEALTDHVFHGDVALIFGDESEMNPYSLNSEPDQIWNQRYVSFSFDTITGGHGQFFTDRSIKQLSTVISRRLADARKVVGAQPMEVREPIGVDLVGGRIAPVQQESHGVKNQKKLNEKDAQSTDMPTSERAVEKAIGALLDHAHEAESIGQHDEARRILQAALELQPTHFQALKRMSLSYLEQDELIAASHLIELALRQQDDPELRVHLARLGKRIGFKSRVRYWLRSVIPRLIGRS